ncbi:MAG: hypothetical protein M3O21_05040 [Chloroflexota bacterium]|nr:hypothetical protein [Chloroflexota bacterium]
MPRDDPSSTKPLLDKLGVKPGMRVAIERVDDADFLQELSARADMLGKRQKGIEMIFLGVEGPDDMSRLAELKDHIARDGAVWVVYRKGRKDFNENDVLRLGLESGMVDVKVVRFSETHTATKYVIRKAER